jgi:hypothetical protein
VDGHSAFTPILKEEISIIIGLVNMEFSAYHNGYASFALEAVRMGETIEGMQEL